MHLSKCASLKTLKLREAHWEHLPALKHLSRLSLATLELPQTSELHAAHLQHLAIIKTLTALTVTLGQDAFGVLASMQQLQSLNLRCFEFSDEQLRQVSAVRVKKLS